MSNGDANTALKMLNVSDEVRDLLAQKADQMATLQEAQADALKKSAAVERLNGKLIIAGFTTEYIAGW